MRIFSLAEPLSRRAASGDGDGDGGVNPTIGFFSHFFFHKPKNNMDGMATTTTTTTAAATTTATSPTIRRRGKMWRGRTRFARGSGTRRSYEGSSSPSAMAKEEEEECHQDPTDDDDHSWFEACVILAQKGTNEVEIVLDVPTYRNWS
jgi:hypothetical protein